MIGDVAASYDAWAEEYASRFIDDLDRDAAARVRLGTFAELTTDRVVADLGCGPGHIVEHLCGLGVDAVGYDVSEGQITQAQRAFPNERFVIGDFTALGLADASLGGIVSRYSILHLPPTRLANVFGEWKRVLVPGAPLLVSFYGSLSAQAHGTPFEHTVVTAYELFPATVAHMLRGAGFVDVDVEVRAPSAGGRPFDQVSLLATTPAG